MPDENSNLNLPASARRPNNNRRRGRRGGRGRGPRPAGKPAAPGEISPAPETAEPTAGGDAPAVPEAVESESPGGFREPHPETPAEFASHETESGEPEDAPAPAVESEPPRPPARPERSPEPPRQRQWVKPANFRPAAPTAISQAVEHATFIAEALKQLHEQMDEVLELVEVAERQKLADERELEEFRRALRRIQPQRHPPSHSQHQHQRGQQRRDEPRRGHSEPREPREQRDREQQEHREPVAPPEEPSRPPEADEPPAAG